MNILTSMYQELCATEVAIRLKLSRAREQLLKPTEKVTLWLQNVERVKVQVESVQHISSGRLLLKLSGRVDEMTREIQQLVKESKFREGVLVADRAQLLPPPTLVGISALKKFYLIWETLMHPIIGTIFIQGMGGSGKTTVMMNIKNVLATTNIFGKVFWVNVSKEWNLLDVQNDIALQLKLDLLTYENEHTRAARLLERLKKLKKFLIIFDDVCAGISLKELGIPEPDCDNGCKIVNISRSNVLGIFNSNANLMSSVCRITTTAYIFFEYLSSFDAWKLFVNKADNIVFTKDIEPLARLVAEKCCGIPIVIVSVGLALADEVSVAAWENALVELSINERGKILLYGIF